MIDLSKLLLGSFSSSVEELSSIYNYLASVPDKDRVNFVESSKASLIKIENEIKSQKTVAAIKLLIQYQYVTRFAFRIHGVDNHGDYNDKSKRYFIERVDHICKISNTPHRIHEKTKWFIYNSPSENEFVETILSVLEKAEFYDKVELAYCDLYGIKFPNSNTVSFGEWVERSGLCEKSWDWRYKDKINELEKKIFKRKSTIDKIRKDWEVQRSDTAKCLKYLSVIYENLSNSVSRLKTLKTDELKLSIRVSNIDKVNQAIIEGTKLKHLLLEEGVELIKLKNALG